MFFFVTCAVCVVVCVVHACVTRVRREGVSVLYRDVKAVGNASRASKSRSRSVSEKRCPTRIENLPDAVSWERDGVSSSRDARARGNADESSAPPRLARARVRIGLCVDASSSPSDETSENEGKKKKMWEENDRAVLGWSGASGSSSGARRAATRGTTDKVTLLPSSRTSSDAAAATFPVVRLRRYPRRARGHASFGCRADDAVPRAGPSRRAPRAAVDAAAAANETPPRIVRVARPGRCEPPGLRRRAVANARREDCSCALGRTCQTLTGRSVIVPVHMAENSDVRFAPDVTSSILASQVI